MQIEYQNHLESRQGEVPVRELLEQAFGSEELGESEGLQAPRIKPKSSHNDGFVLQQQCSVFYIPQLESL